MPIVTGTFGNDVLTGTDGDDEIFGLDGDDTINGGDGNDRIDPGSGVDIVNGGAGNDTLVVTSVRTGFPAPAQTTFDGGTGIDTFDLSAFTLSPHAFWSYSSSTSSFSVVNYTMRNVEVLVGTSGRDIFNLGTFNGVLSIHGGAGDDEIYVGTGAVLVDGGAGNDRLSFYGGSGTFLGGDGDDIIDAFQGASSGATLDGGGGTDTLLFTYQRMVLDLMTGVASGFQITGLTVRNFENVTIAAYGSSTQVLRGTDAANVFKVDYDTGSTSVEMDGRGGDDTIWGSRSADILRGGDENDWLEGRGGSDQLYGDAGNDTILGGAGDDLIDGGAGSDTASFEDLLSTGVTANLLTGIANGSESGIDTLRNIENLRGSDYGDVLTGDDGNNRLEGRSGADVLRGAGGNDYLDGGSSADQLFGDEGDDTLIGGANDDTLDGGTGIDTAMFAGSYSAATITQSGATITVAGTDGRDTLTNIEILQFSDAIVDVVNGQVAAEARMTLNGTAGRDTLVGGGSNDILRAGAGDDMLRGTGGSDLLDGGDGFDTANFSGVRRQYVASSTSVSGNGEGTDTLISIEQARFVDGILTFDASSASAQVMRLYSATLNRVPDQGGLEANTGALASLGLQGLANTFVASAEFQARFGALNNQQFVEQLYQFALGRTGDAPGIASWVALLNGGASRGQVVVGFSESAENVGRTAATLNAGLWVPDQQALVIARLYDATFKRLPDVGGLTGWVNAMKGGTAVSDIAAAFAGSAEFQATFGALSNQAFVEQLYRFCLNREGDAGGIAGWVAALNGGTSRASVLLGFSESAEHIALTANLWLGGIRFAGYVGAPILDDTDKNFDVPQVLPGIEGDNELPEPTIFLPQQGVGDSKFFSDDRFVLPPLEDIPEVLPDEIDALNAVVDLAALRAEAFNNSRMILILPEVPDATATFDLDAWTPNQRDGHWLM
ncbi:DUF4214 domain-containing protein [Brevundimonas sp.]|uniref:DUF4214 domain-containing protein n=1 Tax=Brevundimonas sp. TaxID=1871086 RepID=UPI00263754C6|nr:DUF4214 domain-containing protein [Brevundimonas sp.]